MRDWAIAFALTLVIEVPIVVALLRHRAQRPGTSGVDGRVVGVDGGPASASGQRPGTSGVGGRLVGADGGSASTNAQRPWTSDVLIAVALQLTHPILWLIGPTTWPALVAAELIIWLVEGLALWLLTRPRLTPTTALMGTAVANAASMLVGLFVMPLL